MSTHAHTVGKTVTFKTPGRYSKTLTGKITNVASDFITVSVDGTEKKTRPGAIVG